MGFETWLLTYVEEKELYQDLLFTVEGSQGTLHMVPLSAVLEMIMDHAKDPGTAKEIKEAIVKDDFLNRDPYKFFKHMAGAYVEMVELTEGEEE